MQTNFNEQRFDADELWSLVKQYEPHLRRIIRVQLNCAQARRVIDSIDICQSVYLVLWTRIEENGLHWENQQQLLGLLLGIARHKVLEHVRYHHPQRRDIRRTHSLGEHDTPKLADSPDLTAQDFAVLNRRLAGDTWADAAMGQAQTSNAIKLRIRKTLARLARRSG